MQGLWYRLRRETYYMPRFKMGEFLFIKIECYFSPPVSHISEVFLNMLSEAFASLLKSQRFKRASTKRNGYSFANVRFCDSPICPLRSLQVFRHARLRARTGAAVAAGVVHRRDMPAWLPATPGVAAQASRDSMGAPDTCPGHSVRPTIILVATGA